MTPGGAQHSPRPDHTTPGGELLARAPPGAGEGKDSPSRASPGRTGRSPTSSPPVPPVEPLTTRKPLERGGSTASHARSVLAPEIRTPSVYAPGASDTIAWAYGESPGSMNFASGRGRTGVPRRAAASTRSRGCLPFTFFTSGPPSSPRRSWLLELRRRRASTVRHPTSSAGWLRTKVTTRSKRRSSVREGSRRPRGRRQMGSVRESAHIGMWLLVLLTSGGGPDPVVPPQQRIATEVLT